MKKNFKYVNKNGGIFYYKANGEMATDGWRTLTEDGKKNVYYFCSAGNAYKGWRKVNGIYYYFYPDGNPYPGARAQNVTLIIGKMKCTFNGKGICVKRTPIK